MLSLTLESSRAFGGGESSWAIFPLASSAAALCWAGQGAGHLPLQSWPHSHELLKTKQPSSSPLPQRRETSFNHLQVSFPAPMSLWECFDDGRVQDWGGAFHHYN